MRACARARSVAARQSCPATVAVHGGGATVCHCSPRAAAGAAQSSDGFTKVQEGSDVRLRIVGTKMDQSDIFCIGSIKDDYLGVLGGPV